MKKKNTMVKTVIALSVIGVCLVIAATTYLILNPDVLKKLLAPGGYEVTLISENPTVSRKPDDTITVGDIIKIRSLLENRKFGELNSLLDNYQQLFEENHLDEYKVYDAYRTFLFTIPSYEDLMLSWKEEYPDDYQPRLAIAQYYYAIGWEKRGYKIAADTDDSQFEKMNFYFEKARTNLYGALRINPHLYVAYHTLIGIANARGNDLQKDNNIKKVLELYPPVFTIIDQAMRAKQPRWGGTYKQMEEIAQEVESYSSTNPKLTALYGNIYEDQARSLLIDEDFEEAVELLSNAVSFGDHWQYFYRRAASYLYLKQYDNALMDINRSLELRPTRNDSYLLRSRIHYYKKMYKECAADLIASEQIIPNHPDAVEWKTWAAADLVYQGYSIYKTVPEKAISLLTSVLKIDGSNHEAYYWRGAALVSINKRDQAFRDIEKAISINPRHFDSYKMIDWLYARDGKWELIINYWNRFLELEPEHADAYYERSGTHYHNGDMPKAIKDLENACKYGNEEACARLGSLVK